jgi:hypothetical protein
VVGDGQSLRGGAKGRLRVWHRTVDAVHLGPDSLPDSLRGQVRLALVALRLRGCTVPSTQVHAGFPLVQVSLS